MEKDVLTQFNSNAALNCLVDCNDGFTKSLRIVSCRVLSCSNSKVLQRRGPVLKIIYLRILFIISFSKTGVQDCDGIIIYRSELNCKQVHLSKPFNKRHFEISLGVDAG